jgi:outer membrane protein assembly factor BamE (lipoprotein component of BamABCDE complex)
MKAIIIIALMFALSGCSTATAVTLKRIAISVIEKICIDKVVDSVKSDDDDKKKSDVVVPDKEK